MNKKGELIVALDTDTFEEARELVETLKDSIDIYKVGSQLFTACGPVIIRYLMAQGKRVFLDLKFHDIPNTVANAIGTAVHLNQSVYDVVADNGESLPLSGGVFMITLHTVGGEEMLTRAAQAAKECAKKLGVLRPLLVGVTVLTSEKKADSISAIVLERAKLARKAGLDGVVVSSEEASSVRRELGEDFVIVTPGIRPTGADHGDQKRVTTPAEAINNGSNYLVIGRPIVKATDPYIAAKNILEEIR